MPLSPLAAPPSESTGLTAWVINVMEALGAPGAGLIIGVENLFPPMPSELILPLAGFTASQGSITLFGAILWTTLGSLAGALALYGLGAKLGRARTRAIGARIPLIKISDVDRTEAWFAKHGVKAVFFGRMIPLFRSFISLPAGVERMPLATFSLFTAIGSLLWNTVFIVAGYMLGQNWYLMQQYAGVFSKVVLAAAALAIAYVSGSRLLRERHAKQVSNAPTEEFECVWPTEETERVHPTEEFERIHL